MKEKAKQDHIYSSKMKNENWINYEQLNLQFSDQESDILQKPSKESFPSCGIAKLTLFHPDRTNHQMKCEKGM